MTLPTFTLRQMVEAGVHFGHHARRWNPSMAPYIYGKKDNIHIIDLQKTYPMLYTALNAAREVAAQGGKILFVGTKRQAQDLIKENAERCGQYYVNHRWLGGMLTNWKTVYKSISRLVKLNEMFEKNAFDGYTKKEMQNIKKEQEKLNKELGGIMNMGGQPDMLFVIDTPKEDLAIKEAKKLGIPVVAIVEKVAKMHAVPVTLLCDTNHVLSSGYSKVIVVGAGADAVDYKLISICRKGDIVVSQDYGVAAMALGKGAYAIHQSGKWYTNDNIDQMLMERHLNKKARRSTHKSHMKGPRKRTPEDDERFAQSFEKMVLMAQENED